ncbi:MAG: phytase [Fimbriimonadaceae bacterium]
MLTALLLAAAIADVRPNFATEAVAHDADDPAVWVHPTRPERSLIVGTDKHQGTGGLFVFDLQGRIVQRIQPVDRPNNVDVEGNLVAVTERVARRLRFFVVDPATRRLSDASGNTEVFVGEPGERGAPMGIALYRRPSDRALFAIVSPKQGPNEGVLAQYRVLWNPATRRYDLRFVRRFGTFSGKKEVESIAVDHQLGYVYYSDETVGTRKQHADPDHPRAGVEISVFNQAGWEGDHEGIAIWARPDGTGYLVCTEQLGGNSVFHVFRREGDNAPVGRFRIGSDGTDGIEATSANLGPSFPQGLFVAMNSGDRNFLVVDWRRIAQILP